MPDIRPFRGILYNLQQVNLDDVVAPPYDVINLSLQQELYKRDPHNIIRLILNNASDRYVDAARHFDGWKREQSLVQDIEPAIYAVSQRFSVPGGDSYERKGFIAACRLEDFGKGSVFPHEKTLSNPKEDRFKLFQATGAMFSQIFGIYSDPKRVLDSALEHTFNSEPEREVTYEGVRNRMWKIVDLPTISTIQEYIQHQRIFVADGHHRYETALLYRDSHRLKNPNHTGKESYNFVPMFFTNMNDPGMVILPTHRLLHDLPKFDTADLMAKLEEHFRITSISSSRELILRLEEQQAPAFGLVAKDRRRFNLLQFKERYVSHIGDVPPVVRQLDVTVLHSLIFKHLLGITDEAQEKKLYLDYERDALTAIDAVKSGKAQAAFLMNPTRIEQVRMVAEAGFTMPQKSTYFYPKLLSGLVMYSFAD